MSKFDKICKFNKNNSFDLLSIFYNYFLLPPYCLIHEKRKKCNLKDTPFVFFFIHI